MDVHVGVNCAFQISCALARADSNGTSVSLRSTGEPTDRHTYTLSVDGALDWSGKQLGPADGGMVAGWLAKKRATGAINSLALGSNQIGD